MGLGIGNTSFAVYNSGIRNSKSYFCTSGREYLESKSLISLLVSNRFVIQEVEVELGYVVRCIIYYLVLETKSAFGIYTQNISDRKEFVDKFSFLASRVTTIYSRIRQNSTKTSKQL